MPVTSSTILTGTLVRVQPRLAPRANHRMDTPSASARATLAEFVRGRVDVWEAAGDITARTATRYRQLVENQIVPHLGVKPLQKLTRLDVEAWHATLRTGGLAARTTGLVKSETLRRVRPIATQLAVEAKQVELTQADTVRLVVAARNPEFGSCHLSPAVSAKLAQPVMPVHLPGKPRPRGRTGQDATG